MSNLTFQFEGSSLSATKFEGKSRHFSLTIDEPEELGGKNEAANPVEYILAGFAGCLNVVAHLVAKELNIKVNHLTIDIKGDLNPAKFLGKSDEYRAGYQNINVVIKAETNADEKLYQQWIEEINLRCPVKDNLLNPTPVDIKLENKLFNFQLN